MLGRRLKLARNGTGLSLRALEGRIGKLVTAQAIGKYERDESMPSSNVLIALGKALDVSVDYLLGHSDVELDGIEFRKHKIALRRDQARVEAQVLHLLERYLEVEELLGLSSIEWSRPENSPYQIDSLDQAESAAEHLRESWGFGTGDPIPHKLPELLEEKGIKVLSVKLGERVFGLTANVNRPMKDPIPVVVVNSANWGERQRFTLAHELGHLVLDVPGSLDEEKASNRFAGAFLLPAEMLRSEIGAHRKSLSLGELFSLKDLFGVSAQAIAYRCFDLGIISNSLRQQLFRVFSERGWRSSPFKEPGAIDPGREKSDRFDRLVLRALSEEAISESKAAELLETSVRNLNRLFDAA